jgi:hypothetical protein
MTARIGNITFACEQPVELAVKRLSGLGATVVETKTGTFGETWTVMRDPEGNGFCVQ